MTRESTAPSMEALAAAAGVAASTVSRALRGDPRISAATRTRIRELATKLGYRTNPLVSALMTQLRHGHPPAARCNLAWLDFFANADTWRGDPVHQAFYTGVCERASGVGYAISRIQANDRPADRLARLLRNRGIRGVLVPNFDHGRGIASNIPLPLDEFTFVCVGARFEKPMLHYVSDDQYESGRIAVQRMWDLGYRRIGYFGEPRVEQIVNGRFFAGYHATLTNELGGAAHPPLLSENHADAIRWLKKTRVEAIVTASRRLLSVLRSQGVRVPGDVALAHLNIDDVEGAAAGEVAGVRQDSIGVGANAVELLVSLLNQNELGVPLHPRGVQIHGTWIDGPTARPH